MIESIGISYLLFLFNLDFILDLSPGLERVYKILPCLY